MRFKPKDYDRRELFKIFGGSAILLHPILSVRDAYASADAEAEAKRRLLVFHTPHGFYREAFWPKGDSNNYNFKGTTLEPLTAMMKNISVIQGANINRANVDAHRGGIVHLLTGNGAANNFDKTTSPALSASIDMIYASTLKNATKISSLNLSVGAAGDEAGRYVSYNDKGARQPSHKNPYNVYSTLFSPHVGCGGPDVFNPDDVTLLKRRSMLDALKDDLKTASNRTGLGAEERRKLEEFAQSIRDLEMNLSAGSKDDDVCASLSDVTVEKSKQLGASRTTLTQYSKMMADLVVVAFQLDLTRVITISYSTAGKYGVPYAHLKLANKALTSDHHSITHQTRDPNDWRQKLALIDKWHAGEFASLITRLNNIKEGDSNILRNSMAYWSSEIAEGKDHTKTNAPMVVAGTGAGKFKTGNYIRAGDVNHHGLLLDLLEGVGVNRNSIGNSGANPKRFLKKA